MTLVRRLLLTVWLSLPLVPFAARADEPLVATIRGIKPAIVGMASYDILRQPQSLPLGTGFVVADGNHAITNLHVVDGVIRGEAKGSLVVLTGSDGNVDVRKADIVESDPNYDLVLVHFAGEPLPTLALRPGEDTVPEGTAVAMTGFPIAPVLGLYPATHRGVIAAVAPNVIPQGHSSQLDPALVLARRFDMYQLDMVAFPGNSGSPVYLVETGEVIGVINSTFIKGTKEKAISDPSGISYAIPIKFARQLLRRARLAH